MTTGNSTSRGSRTFAKRCRWTLEAGNPSDKGLARSGADLSPSSTTHHQKSSVSAQGTDNARRAQNGILGASPATAARPPPRRRAVAVVVGLIGIASERAALN